MTIDRNLIKSKGKGLITPVLVTNMERLETIEVFKGENIKERAAIVKINL